MIKGSGKEKAQAAQQRPEHLSKDYYRILGLDRHASQTDIENAFKRQSRAWHPEKHPQNRVEAQKRFNLICEAYATLSDVSRRHHYDSRASANPSLEEAEKAFSKFFEEEGIRQEDEKGFFQKHYPQRKRSYYEVLGVPKNASMNQIKNAYRKLALQYHPRNNPDDKEAERRFLEVHDAFNHLRDQVQRKHYDQAQFEEMPSSVAHNIFDQFFSSDKGLFEDEEEFFKPIVTKGKQKKRQQQQQQLQQQRHQPQQTPLRNLENQMESWSPFVVSSYQPLGSMMNMLSPLGDIMDSMVAPFRQMPLSVIQPMYLGSEPTYSHKHYTSTIQEETPEGTITRTITERSRVQGNDTHTVRTEEVTNPDGIKTVTEVVEDNGIRKVNTYKLQPGESRPQLTYQKPHCYEANCQIPECRTAQQSERQQKSQQPLQSGYQQSTTAQQQQPGYQQQQPSYQKSAAASAQQGTYQGASAYQQQQPAYTKKYAAETHEQKAGAQESHPSQTKAQSGKPSAGVAPVPEPGKTTKL